MQTTSRTVVLRLSIWASFREGEGGHIAIAIAMSLFEGYMTWTCTGRSAAGLPYMYVYRSGYSHCDCDCIAWRAISHFPLIVVRVVGRSRPSAPPCTAFCKFRFVVFLLCQLIALLRILTRHSVCAVHSKQSCETNVFVALAH